MSSPDHATRRSCRGCRGQAHLGVGIQPLEEERVVEQLEADLGHAHLDQRRAERRQPRVLRGVAQPARQHQRPHVHPRRCQLRVLRAPAHLPGGGGRARSGGQCRTRRRPTGRYVCGFPRRAGGDALEAGWRAGPRNRPPAERESGAPRRRPPTESRAEPRTSRGARGARGGGGKGGGGTHQGLAGEQQEGGGARPVARDALHHHLLLPRRQHHPRHPGARRRGPRRPPPGGVALQPLPERHQRGPGAVRHRPVRHARPPHPSPGWESGADRQKAETK